MPAISKTAITPSNAGAGAPPVDLNTALSRAGQLTTKADVASALTKSGLSASALADALISGSPASKTATADFVTQLRDALQAEADKIKSTPGQKPSAKLLERIAGLDTLAKSLAPTEAKTVAKPVSQDEVGKTVVQDKSAAQKKNDIEKTGAEHKVHAKRASKAGLGFDTVEQTPKTEATAATEAKKPADIGAAFTLAKSQIDQIDYMLQTLPEGDKRPAFEALSSGKSRGPASTDTVFAAINAFKQNMTALTATMAPGEQRAFFDQFNINYDVAMAGQQNPGAQTSTTPGLNTLTHGIKANPANPTQDPTIGSRVSPLEQSPILGGGIGQAATGQGPSVSSMAPVDQLSQIFLQRLSLSSIQPTQLPAINWRDPLAVLQPGQYESIGPRGVPKYAPPQGASVPAAPMPGALDKLFKSFTGPISADQMVAFLKQAKAQKISPDDIVDNILSGGPFVQLTSRMNDGGKTLVEGMNKNDPKFEQRIQGLHQLATQGVSDGNPSNPNNLVGPADVKALLSQGGASAMQLGAQILSGKGPLAGRLTQDAVGAVIEGIDPKSAKTQAEADAAVNMVQQLQQLMPSLPVGVGAIPPGAAGQQGFIQQALGAVMNNPFMNMMGNRATAAMATAGMGFMPTGYNTLDLANAIANSPTYSPTEQSLLDQIKDPQQRAMQELQMQMQKQALLATMLTNLANMRFEALKAVANNFRG